MREEGMRFWLGVFAIVMVGGLLLASPLEAQQAPVIMKGSVQKVEGGVLTISTDAGPVQVTLSREFRISLWVPINFSEVKVGDFVGVTAMGAPGTTLTASEVHVFPEAMRGTGEGQRPSIEGSLMTNATIGEIAKEPEGRLLTLTYKGKTAKILVPEKAMVTRVASGKPEDLQPGRQVFLFGVREGGQTKYMRMNILP